MTAKEFVIENYPEFLNDKAFGGIDSCTQTLLRAFHLKKLCENSKESICRETCTACWNQEIPYEPQKQPTDTPTQPQILDSGNRREFETGAVRDIQEGKGRCDLLPLDIIGDLLSNEIFYNIDAFQHGGDFEYLRVALEIFLRDKSDWDIYTAFLELAKHFEAGAKKYGERNWQKGIPVRCYIDSAVRHYLKLCRGDTDEPHDRAFVWNIVCAIWTCVHMPELNEYAREEQTDEYE